MDLFDLVNSRVDFCSRSELQEICRLLLPLLKQDFLRSLPSELSFKILAMLDLRSIVRARQVSKDWLAKVDGLGADLYIWKKRLTVEFPLIALVPPYKGLYKHSFLTRQNWFKGRYNKLSFPGHTRHVVTCLLFDKERIVSGSDDQSIHIYDIHKGELIRKLLGHEGGVWALQYYNNTLVSGSTDRSVRIWNMETGKCTHIFEGHTSTVRCLLIIPQITMPIVPLNMNRSSNIDGDIKQFPLSPLIVTGSRDASLRIWRLPDLSTRWKTGDAEQNPYFICSLEGHTNSVRAIAGFNNILVSGSYDTTVRVWNLHTGACLHVFQGHTEKVYSVGYCDELKRACSGSMDATIRIWDTEVGVCLYTLEGHTSLVGLLELTPKYLVSAAADATLKIWSPVTGRCLASLTGHSNAITCFQHDPLSNRIVSGSDGGVKIWELACDGYGKNDSTDLLSIIPKESRLYNTLSFSQGPTGKEPLHGRFVDDILSDAQGVWRARMDDSKLVCAVARADGKTWFEVLDFSEFEGQRTSRKAAGDRFFNSDGNDEDEVMDDEMEEDED